MWEKNSCSPESYWVQKSSRSPKSLAKPKASFTNLLKARTVQVAHLVHKTALPQLVNGKCRCLVRRDIFMLIAFSSSPKEEGHQCVLHLFLFPPPIPLPQHHFRPCYFLWASDSEPWMEFALQVSNTKDLNEAPDVTCWLPPASFSFISRLLSLAVSRNACFLGACSSFFHQYLSSLIFPVHTEHLGISLLSLKPIFLKMYLLNHLWENQL